MSIPILLPLKPMTINDRLTTLFLEKGNLDVLDDAFVLVDKSDIHTHIPVRGVACLMLGSGIRVSLSVVVLASPFGDGQSLENIYY